jgi:hypothetical protein
VALKGSSARNRTAVVTCVSVASTAPGVAPNERRKPRFGPRAETRGHGVPRDFLAHDGFGQPNTRRLSDTPLRLLAVAISERTRKVLWGRAGARCSHCRAQVVGEGTGTDDPSVFGEEAHIVARSPGGPRAGNYAGDIDGYDNLILLCSKCHKQVDDHVNSYSEDRLLKIKRDHEAWAAKLGEKTDPGPMRLVPDPAHPVPKRLKLFTSGTAFWHYFADCYSFRPSWIEGLSDEHEDVITAFLQELKDWMDGGTGDLSYSEHREASKAMSHHITELARAGFVLGARKRHLLLTDDSDLAQTPWRVLDIEIQPAYLVLKVDADGRPISEAAENAMEDETAKPD